MPTQYVFAQMERVSKKLPEWMGSMNVVTNKIKKKSTATMVSERDFRVAYLTTDGGRFGTYSPDGGAIGRGSGPEGGVMIQTVYPFSFRAEITQLAKDATDSQQKANLNVFNRTVTKMAVNFPNAIDRVFHRSNQTPEVATATGHTTVSSNSVYTFANGEGVMGLRRGEYYQLYSNDLTTIRTGGPYKLLYINYETNTATFSGTVTSAAATDKVCIEVTGASPTGPTGLKYHNSVATSGTTHGVNRANENEIIASGIDLAGGIPTFQKALQMHIKISKRRGTKGVPSGTEILCSPEQNANIRKQVQNIANFDLTRGKVNADLMPAPDSTFNFGGVPATIDNVQDTTRLDYVNFSDWEKIELSEMGFYTTSDGKKFFPIYGADGSPAAAEWFALTWNGNWVCTNPGAGAVMYNAGAPTY